MEDHPNRPDPTPTSIPFTFATVEERDTQVIPEPHSHGGSYTIPDAQANTAMPDAPSAPRSEGTSATSTAQQGNTSTHENPIALEPQSSSHPTPLYETQTALDSNTSSQVPPALIPQFIQSAPATSKPSSSTTAAAPPQDVPSTSEPSAQDTQGDQEEIVPIGRALEVDVCLQRIP